MASRYIYLIGLVLLFSGFLSGAVRGQVNRIDVKDETVDIEMVRQKIEMLGIRDDSLEYNEKPEKWLKSRRDKVVKELIAGLDNEKRRVGLGCLRVLGGVKNRPELVDALVRIAVKPEHPIYVEAMYRLCEFAEDKRARKLLEEAWRDEQRFKDTRWRARMATSVGENAAAVKLLLPLLNHESGSEVIQTIQQLGEIGHKDAIGPLEKFRNYEQWSMAADAYLALAKIDPQDHGLTKDQEHFLKESTFQTKANTDFYIKRWKELISLDREQIRGLVLANIRSEQPGAGLVLLQLWKDKESLPELRRLLSSHVRRGRQLSYLAAAYLCIEGTGKSIEEVASYFKKQFGFSHWRIDYVLRAVGSSIMPTERKLEILLGFRKCFTPEVIAKNVFYGFSEEEKAELLEPLMKTESDWMALGYYAQAAASDKKKRFGKLVETTLDKLTADEVTNEQIDAEAVRLIYDAAIKYSLPGSGRKAEAFLSHPQRLVRISAAHITALLGGDRTKALALLYEALWNEDNAARAMAASCLVGIPCLNDDEKQQREDVLLSHIGRKSEDYAMRVLVTCAGQKTAEKLLPILDDPDVTRAVYVAWILAQHPDGQMREKGIRRIIIYSMFFHQIYQQGAGIDFDIAPGLEFHQTTMSMRPQELRHSKVVIPKDGYVPSNLDEKEQQFSIRAYRYARLLNYHSYIYGLESWPPHKAGWDRSHLPLLEVIAREDPFVKVAVIKDKPVVHFPRRQEAAKAIATFNPEKAFYAGLDNEKIESSKMPPGPYEKQAFKTARFLVRLVQEVLIKEELDKEIPYKKAEALQQIFRDIMPNEPVQIKAFSEALKKELISRSHIHGMEKVMKEARLIP